MRMKIKSMFILRLKIDEKVQIKWVDQIRGEIKWQGKDLGGDLVL